MNFKEKIFYYSLVRIIFRMIGNFISPNSFDNKPATVAVFPPACTQIYFAIFLHYQNHPQAPPQATPGHPLDPPHPLHFTTELCVSWRRRSARASNVIVLGLYFDTQHFKNTQFSPVNFINKLQSSLRHNKSIVGWKG